VWSSSNPCPPAQRLALAALCVPPATVLRSQFHIQCLRHAKALGNHLKRDGRNNRLKQLSNTMAVEELFSKALHFPVDDEQQPVDSDCVQNAIAFWDRVGRPQWPSDFETSARTAKTSSLRTGRRSSVVWSMRNEQIGDLGLVRAPGGEHTARVSKAASRRND